jgi:hypothetical protein
MPDKMISFFRKIRQALLTENKFSRYLVYAAGEIILVIIGIFIALQVNNANEIRKKEKIAIGILKQIQQDLITSVEEADRIIEYYRKKDSLSYLVLNDKVIADDYIRDRNLMVLTLNYNTYIILDYGFQKLDQYLDFLPKGSDLLKKNLNQLYTNLKITVEDANDAIAVEVRDHRKMLKENKSWYWNTMYGISNNFTEAIQYALSDPLYKNYVSSYHTIAINNLCASTLEFRTDAIRIYKEIDKTINSINETFTKAFPFYIDTENYTNWTGKYKCNYLGTESTIKIFIEDGTLFYLGSSKWEILPLTATKFYLDGWSIFYSFIMDENKNITGIRYSNLPTCLTYVKIE